MPVIYYTITNYSNLCKIQPLYHFPMLSVNTKLGDYKSHLWEIRVCPLSPSSCIYKQTEPNPIINVTLALLSSAHGQAHNRSPKQWGGAWVLLAESNEMHLLLIAPCHHCQNPSISISAPVLAQWWKVPRLDKTLNLPLTNHIEPIWLISQLGARQCVYHANSVHEELVLEQHNIIGKPVNQWPPGPAPLDQQLNHSVLHMEVIIPDFCLSLYSHAQETFCLYICIFCQIKDYLRHETANFSVLLQSLLWYKQETNPNLKNIYSVF